MKEVIERLYQLFKNTLDYDIKENSKREVLQNILKSTQWENVTEIDLFVQFQNSLEIPILLIEVERNETNKIETYQTFRLKSNKWEISNIGDVINIKTLLVMYKFKQVYEIFEMFTEANISDYRIAKLIQNEKLFLIEIGIDLLMRYSKSPKCRYICTFINDHPKNSYGKNFLEVLHDTGRNDVIKFLLQNECKFPNEENLRNIPLIKKRLKSNIEFHELIKDENLEEIDKFIEENPNQQYILNEYNCSACWVAAIEMENLELFNFLCKKGLSFTDEELLHKLEDKKDFFITHTYSGLDLNYILNNLESKTLRANKTETDLSVNDIYKELRKIPSVNLILNILNKIRKIVIYIDYQESISRLMHYRYPEYYFFVLDDTHIDTIFISGGGGTKQLLGKFALEITHFAIYWFYKNYGKPYYSEDDKNQNRFNEILQNTRKKIYNGSIYEEFSKSVFDHSEKYWHSELISRVNYAFAFYGQDRGKKILQQYTPELLEFYETCVKPDLEKYLRGHFNHNYDLFNTKWHRRMENHNADLTINELNNLWIFTTAAYSKNVVVQSDYVELTCLKLFKNITTYNNSPLNIDNTYFIDLKTFSNSNYKIVSHLPQWELLILFDTFERPLTPNYWRNILHYIKKVGKRFIFVFDMERKSSYQAICQDNVDTFTDSFKPMNIDRTSVKLIFELIIVKFPGQFKNLRELINFEEYLNISHKFISLKFIQNFFSEFITPTIEQIHDGSSFYQYIKRKFITTIFELDELRDEIVEKFVCENITGKSKESNFNLKTKSNKFITFPGKTLKTKDFKPLSESMEISSDNNKDENDIFIISLKDSSESFIIIDEEIEIEINNFSYTDMETFYKNNSKFNIHWFLESDTSRYFFNHLKTFGSFDKTRSFCYRQKCTIDERYLLEKLQHQKVFLIAAPAGMGKTETMKAMARMGKHDSSSLWPPVVILRKHSEILKTFRPENPDPDYLFDFLTELLEYRDFEKEIFKICCKRNPNNVCLFFDGADENGPEFTEIIIELIKRLSLTNIKHIIVTTRLIGKFEFEYELETIAIEMEPFSHDEKVECLMNTWEDNIEIQMARRVAKHFREFDDFFNNSLQIVLIAKICEGQRINFLKNLINVYLYFKDELSLIEMYKKFIENQLKSRVPKGQRYPKDFMAQAQIKNSQRQLQYAAIRVLLNDDNVKLFLTLEDIQKHKHYIKVLKNWQDYEGIVDGIYSEKLDFVHRTYAEYFFADYLLNHYRVWNTNTEQFFFENILVDKEFQYVRKFLNSYGIQMGSSGNFDIISSRRPTHFQVPATFHAAVAQNIEENNTKILYYLYTLGFNLTINLSPLITKHINNDSPNSIEKLIATIKYLVQNCGTVHLSINELLPLKLVIHKILRQDRIELIKLLLQCELNDLNDDELYQDQTKSFRLLWDEAKAQVKTDHKTKDSKELLQLFDDILQMININGKALIKAEK